MSIVRFVKDWTLPVAMGLGASVYALFATVPALDGVGRWAAPLMEGLLPVFMFLVLFVTFCKVDFRRMRPVWWQAWVLGFNLLSVAIVVALIVVCRLRGEALVLAEALLMCVVAPCATAAAVVTQKLGGSIEQVTTYTFLSNFLTALLVPLCFPMIEQRADLSFLAAAGRILYQVAVVLLVPMLLAYVVKHRCHRLHRRLVAVSDLSFYLWCCSLMIVTGVTVKNIVHAEAGAPLLVAIALLGLVLCVVQFAVGRFIGHYFNRTQEAGQSLGQKNTALAIWMSIAYLTPLSSVGPGCYILWQNIVNSLEIWQKRRSDAEKHA